MGFVLGHAGPGCSAHVRGMRGGAELRGRGRGPTATPSRPHRRPPRRHSRSRSGLAAGSRPLTSLYVLCIYIHRRNKGIKKKKKKKKFANPPAGSSGRRPRRDFCVFPGIAFGGRKKSGGHLSGSSARRPRDGTVGAAEGRAPFLPSSRLSCWLCRALFLIQIHM